MLFATVSAKGDKNEENLELPLRECHPKILLHPRHSMSLREHRDLAEASIEPEKESPRRWRDCPQFSTSSSPLPQPDSDLHRLTICLPATTLHEHTLFSALNGIHEQTKRETSTQKAISIIHQAMYWVYSSESIWTSISINRPPENEPHFALILWDHITPSSFLSVWEKGSKTGNQ